MSINYTNLGIRVKYDISVNAMYSTRIEFYNLTGDVEMVTSFTFRNTHHIVTILIVEHTMFATLERGVRRINFDFLQVFTIHEQTLANEFFKLHIYLYTFRQ